MKKVMIVDDDGDLRSMTELLMKNEGYETLTATEGNDFLQKVSTFSPDVVILDVMMPGLSTKEILDQLQKNNQTAKVILFTAVHYSNEEKENIKKKWNVVDYISKPFDADALIEAVQKQLN